MPINLSFYIFAVFNEYMIIITVKTVIVVFKTMFLNTKESI